ncbi:MAG: hypothetical protein HYZ81_12200, partial [Nitrospinae bacterium]|nr:hypothetical protein [Nitrospinota bacterium]
GDPLERDPDLVCADVRNEKITADYARREYGVVLDEQTWTVDQRATEALRSTLRKEREQQSQGKATVPLLSADA